MKEPFMYTRNSGLSGGVEQEGRGEERGETVRRRRGRQGQVRQDK
jgi:hypothetical protein